MRSGFTTKTERWSASFEKNTNLFQVTEAYRAKILKPVAKQMQKLMRFPEFHPPLPIPDRRRRRETPCGHIMKKETNPENSNSTFSTRAALSSGKRA